MLYNRLRWLAVLLTLSITLTACAGAAPRVKIAGPDTVTALAFNPADGSLLKTDGAGLFRLAAGADTWEAVETPAISGLTAIAVNPDDRATLYVTGPEVGVLKSTDGGQSWSAINTGLPSTDVSALAMHSSRRETLYVWVRGENVYATEDGGQSWKKMPDTLTPFEEATALVHSTLPGSMNTGWLYGATATGAYLSMDCF